jgi:ComF family protein
MVKIVSIKESVLHFFFPHTCTGCGSDLLPVSSTLCIRCLDAMPETNFESLPGNTVEKLFWGRVPLQAATAQFYFTKESLMQHLMHQLKYKGNKELGWQLGRVMGEEIKRAERFMPDVLIPLPLFPAKEKKRGYNQATVLCEGMAEAMHIPVIHDAVIRSSHTETQTKKGRIERWQNMEGKFVLANTASIANKHILLVDDVVTTGATLEACAAELLKAENTRVSIATLCYASR